MFWFEIHLYKKKQNKKQTNWDLNDGRSQPHKEAGEKHFIQCMGKSRWDGVVKISMPDYVVISRIQEQGNKEMTILSFWINFLAFTMCLNLRQSPLLLAQFCYFHCPLILPQMDWISSHCRAVVRIENGSTTVSLRPGRGSHFIVGLGNLPCGLLLQGHFVFH